MIIAIDISQIVYEGTGVARYVREMVEKLVQVDTENEFILLGYSCGRKLQLDDYIKKIKKINPQVRAVVLPLPVTAVEFIWNRLHLVPVEWLIGKIDVFWSSDWIQPPMRQAVGITTIHDLTIFRYPESFDRKIVETHQRRLKWIKKECRAVLCDSESTKRDVNQLLGISLDKLYLVYPGL